MDTIEQFCIRLVAQCSEGTERDQRYTRTLFGPRIRGSTTAKGIDQLDYNTPLVPIVPTVGRIEGCKYYHVALTPDFGARLRAGALEDHPDAQLRLGAHGPELFVTGFPTRVPVSFATIVQGPDGSIWTWFPGCTYETFSDRFIGSEFSFTKEGTVIDEALFKTPKIQDMIRSFMAAHPKLGVKLEA